jgi:hypothetical protein
MKIHLYMKVEWKTADVYIMVYSWFIFQPSEYLLLNSTDW